jgi:rhodanese-related sulfurtransferase
VTSGALDAPDRLRRVSLLSPLGVLPEHSHAGIGSALVRRGLALLATRGERLVFLEGSPRFYGRLGFRNAEALGFRRPSLRIPAWAFQLAVLGEGGAVPEHPGTSGTLVYPQPFWDHDAVGLRGRVPRVGADGLTAAVRAGTRRLEPYDALAAVRGGALLVDTRTEAQRREQGELPGALVIDRTVLEWRLDPEGVARIPEATGWDVEVVVVCRQGYSSSLAAASLRAMGLHRATDLAGGVEAWIAAGLPMWDGPADVRR